MLWGNQLEQGKKMQIRVGFEMAYQCPQSQASAGQVLVSRTVKDLVAGSGILFGESGAFTLKGVPGEWVLYSAK